jgi:hypothetical protein
MRLEAQQLDLFAGPPPAEPGAPRRAVDAEALCDAALISALPGAGQTDAPALAEECGRRKLVAAVLALEALCRRFKGFGQHSVVPEQRAALSGLRGIGGAAAAEAVVRLLAGSVVQGPGLTLAVATAASLGARLPEPLALMCLRHPDPPIRADACRCARASIGVVEILVELLSDLHPTVADAAACALGRAGRAEGRARLVRCLVLAPSIESIAAFAAVADDDGVVLLGRLALSHPELSAAVLAALGSIDTERAAVVANGVRRRVANSASPSRED